MVDLHRLEAHLTALEIEIHGWIAQHSDGRPAAHESISDLVALKAAVDRIRPLMWIQLRRLGIAEVDGNSSQPPADVAKIMAVAGLEPSGPPSDRNE